MKPRSLSASAATCYEACPKRFEAEWVARAPSISGSAANLGTACHKTFERWVAEGHYLDHPTVTPAATKALGELWDESYWASFADPARYDEGWGLCTRWLKRQDWAGRTVLSTEAKKSFALATSAGPIPFTYIMDRVDRHDDGDIEVVDYKSVTWPVQPEDLKQRVQSRAYALAAWKEHPGARRIWVTFDLLRHDPVGIVFSPEECEATEKYLLALAERVLADDDPAEQLNAECRWCVRKAVCSTLAAYEASAGPMGNLPIGEAAATRMKLALAKSALDARIKELDEQLVSHLSGQGVDSVEVDGLVVALSSSRRRQVDAARLAELIPYDAFASLATIGVTALDDLLKSPQMTSEERSLIRRCISWRSGSKGVTVKRATAS